MKYIISLLTLFIYTASFAQQASLKIGLSGNGYVTRHHDGAQITEKGLEDWTNRKSIVSIYFYVQHATSADLSLYAKGQSEIKVVYGKKSFKVHLQSEEFAKIPVGSIDIPEAGYVRIDLQGISKKGNDFGEIEQLIVDNASSKCNYVKDFSDYWGRRGPSVHLMYPMPTKGDIEWFYNEVTVPKEGEVMYSYYMANGFREGYFGMQYNSPTERRILFSVWSPFNTEDPKLIPDSLKIKMLRRGEGVHIGEFGNEGSGGQSYLNYPWKAGKTYKFLTQIHPDGNGNTIYTAYFYATDEKSWKLIASFLRPQTDTWYQQPHSFLENFSPEQGYLSRNVSFGNQWVRSKDGKWTRLTVAVFTHDETASAKVRLDYQGGNTNDNRFYLKMGGFFNESVPMGTRFYCRPTGEEPEIDWEALKNL